MRIVAALVAAVLLLAASPQLAASERAWVLLPQLIFRLYEDLSDDAFACTGFYWREAYAWGSGLYGRPVARPWMLTAGHCNRATYRRQEERVWHAHRWPTIAVVHGPADFAAWQGADWRRDPVFPTADALRVPSLGELHYTAGYGGHLYGADGGKSAGVLRLQALTFRGVDSDGTYEYQSSARGALGHSGSPVLNDRGELVGIFVALRIRDRSIVYVSPISALYEYAPWLRAPRNGR